MGDGHLFVVHGRLETLVHDAAVVPTDDAFTFADTWAPLLAGASPESLRPPGWPGPGHGRAADGRPLWFVGVGPGLSTAALVERAAAVAADVVWVLDHQTITSSIFQDKTRIGIAHFLLYGWMGLNRLEG